MTSARKFVYRPGEAGVFHCINRCVRTRPDAVSGWSDEEVARRWLPFCPGRRDPVDAGECRG
ncbi:MAG: hypothetical protein JJT96_14985 [Opitutales bacterium]|nr:hypothetical protein [Opitutales bacterium]